MLLKKQSFVAVAAILMIANAISKILGAVFKIPLTYIIGEEGMAVYNTAFGIYIMFLSFIISGLPFAVSKLVSEYSSSKRLNMVRYTVKLSNTILFIAGLAGSVMLYMGAEFFALAMKEEKAVFAIQMISPSIFFVAAGTTVRSYYQGISNMIPTAASQIIESVIKLAAGYILAIYFLKWGVSAASGGAVMGVTIGEAAATAVFLVIYIVSKKPSFACTAGEKSEVRSALFNIAVPLLFSSVVSSMLSVVDTTVIRTGLLESGLASDEARRVYGSYTGYALTVLHLPIGILATLGVSILPVIAGNIAISNIEKARAASVIAVRLSVILSVPCAVIVYWMSSELLDILFENTASSVMLAMTAPCIVMISSANIIMSIIQSTGKIITVFVYTSIIAILKIILCMIFMRDMGIYGAILSANICYFVEMAVSAIIIKKILGLKFGIKETIIKPGFAAMVMCIIIYLIKQPLEASVNEIIPRTAVICIFSLTGYMASLTLTSSEDIKQLFNMRKSEKTIEKASSR